MSRFSEKKIQRQFEITGLIDIVFILLVFFMVIIVPGSGGGEADAEKMDLPEIKGDTPDEIMRTVMFRIETDRRAFSKNQASPNVIYFLYPYDDEQLGGGKKIKFELAYAQAKADTNRSENILPMGDGVDLYFSENEDELESFILSSLLNYKKNYEQPSGVMISAEVDTPFGLIDFIFKACEEMGILNLEFRTAS
jgi:biopolymer transport protein ExbD